MMRRLSRIAAAVVAAALLVASGIPARAQAPQAPDSLERVNQSIDALTRKVWPSVVQILVTGYGARDEGGRGDVSAVVTRQRSIGSGFVIDPDGYIMTNAHVVSGAQHIQVVLPPPDADGSLATALSPKTKIVTAHIIGISTEIDLAVLRIEGGMKLPALPLAQYTKVRQGETVFAFGSPGGLRNTLTHGMVSAVARQTDPDSPLIYIQTDAPINPGNSGGPLVNSRGEVVVNTFILSNSGGNEGLGFAIPCATVRTVFHQLTKYGQLRRQEVGMSLQTITHTMATSLELPREFGVIVSDVWPGGPAEAAGMKVGDILVSIDDAAADNVPTVNYMFRLRDTPDPVKIVVLRGGTERTLAVKAVEEKTDLDAIADKNAGPQANLVPELGIMGLEIDANIAAQAKGLRDLWGVIVLARAAGAAGEVPLQPRDVIRSLNNQPTVSLRSLRELLKGLKPGAPVTLQIQRDGRLMYVSFTLD
jgi:serine protease Do